jgi:hypothetical protein
MWRALAPFVSALSQEDSRVALALLEAIARRDAYAALRRLRRQAARRRRSDVVAILDQWLTHPDVLSDVAGRHRPHPILGVITRARGEAESRDHRE